MRSLSADEQNFAAPRSYVSRQLIALSFAEQLRRFFSGLVHGTLDQCRCSRGSQADQAMQAIKASVAECFVASLRLDAVTMKLEHDDSLFSE